MGLKVNTAIFVARAKKIRGDVYDYSTCMYKDSYTKVKITCKRHCEFLQSPGSHLSGTGCPRCSSSISKPETEFLNLLKIKQRNYRLPEWKSKPVDGFDKKNNTVYEFLGDYWHGNPQKFSMREIHPHRKFPFNRVYKETFDSLDKIKNLGYTVKYIWESDWNNWDGIGPVPVKEHQL